MRDFYIYYFYKLKRADLRRPVIVSVLTINPDFVILSAFQSDLSLSNMSAQSGRLVSESTYNI